MAEATSASIVSLHQPKLRLSAADRAKAYRERKKAEALAAASVAKTVTPSPTRTAVAKAVTPPPAPTAVANAVTPAPTVANDVTPSPAPIAVTKPVKPSRRIAQWFLIAAALGLGAVGITVNGTFARSLGSTESPGGCFSPLAWPLI